MRNICTRDRSDKCDYRGALEFSSTNGYTQSEVYLSMEKGFDNEDTRLSFTRPTKYKTILLIGDSEKNNK